MVNVKGHAPAATIFGASGSEQWNLRAQAGELWIPAKSDTPCCVSKRDDDGRLPIGDCGPDCQRRQARLRRMALLDGD